MSETELLPVLEDILKELRGLRRSILQEKPVVKTSREERNERVTYAIAIVANCMVNRELPSMSEVARRAGIPISTLKHKKGFKEAYGHLRNSLMGRGPRRGYRTTDGIEAVEDD